MSGGVQTDLAMDSDLIGSDYGIDYLRISFPVPFGVIRCTKVFPDLKRWPNGTTTTSSSLKLYNGSQWIWIAVYGRPHRPSAPEEYYCSVSFNPARFVDPDGILLCSADDLPTVVDHVLSWVERRVLFYEDMSHDLIRVKRLDVASNFYGVTSPARVLRALEHVPRPYAKRNRLYRSRSGVPETLRAGSKTAGWASLYNKRNEVLNRKGFKPSRIPDPGTMRFEVQGYKGWLAQHGIKTLADVTTTTVGNLSSERGYWFGLEREIMSAKKASEVLAASDLTNAMKGKLLTFIYNTLRGDDLGVSNQTAASYTKTLLGLGITPYLEPVKDQPVTHLDVKSHSEVRVA